MHRRYTGKDNRLILRNLEILGGMKTPFVIRVPLIPGVTDTVGNLEAMAQHLSRMPAPPPVELLPYNPLAGAKYASAGIAFQPDFNPQQPVEPRLEIFQQSGLSASLQRRASQIVDTAC